MAYALIAAWEFMDRRYPYNKVATVLDSPEDCKRASIVIGLHGKIIKNRYGRSSFSTEYPYPYWMRGVVRR